MHECIAFDAAKISMPWTVHQLALCFHAWIAEIDDEIYIAVYCIDITSGTTINNLQTLNKCKYRTLYIV